MKPPLPRKKRQIPWEAFCEWQQTAETPKSGHGNLTHDSEKSDKKEAKHQLDTLNSPSGAF